MSEALTAPTAPVGPVDDPMVPNPYEVVGRREEGADTVTLTLAPTGPALPAARPGQFFMLWAPGVGEVPISLGGSGPDGTIDETCTCTANSTRPSVGCMATTAYLMGNRVCGTTTCTPLVGRSSGWLGGGSHWGGGTGRQKHRHNQE